jgi:hypothetical protein
MLGAMPTMAWRFLGRVCLVVHGPKGPADLEWRTFVRTVTEHQAKFQGRVMVVSHGGGPDGHQRKLLTDAVAHAPAPTVIMTSSSLMQAIAKALRFFNAKLRAVGLDENEHAFEFLGLTAAERIAAQAARSEIEVELGLRAG